MNAIELADRLVQEALDAQNEDRYGDLTNPFMMGLLTAADIVRTTLSGRTND